MAAFLLKCRDNSGAVLRNQKNAVIVSAADETEARAAAAAEYEDYASEALWNSDEIEVTELADVDDGGGGVENTVYFEVRV